MVDEIEELYNELATISDVMDLQIKQSDSRMLYEGLSGAIIWSDELPACEFNCMRFVFRYRTGILINKPDPSFESFWQEARRKFPKWIGFSADRVKFRNDAVTVYNQARLNEFGPS